MSKIVLANGTILARALLIVLLATPLAALAKTVLIETPLGNIEIELLENEAPKTVANFLKYVEDGKYNKSFVHRSVGDFIIQGGGFFYINDTAFSITTFPPVENEPGVSNTRGTVAMAKLGDQPDSATSQWFINLSDNSGNLDNQNGGFTVFGRVIGNGMAVADAINDLQNFNGGGPFTDLPVIDSTGQTPPTGDNLVWTDVSVSTGEPEEPAFVMNSGLNDAWYDPATDGQGFFVTVFPDIGKVFLSWFTYDTELPSMDAESNLGDAGHRWLTAIGTINGNTAVLEIDSTAGGIFDSGEPISHTPDGTMTLTFDSCTSGVVEYDIISINQQGSVPIQRVAGDNIALCEALSESDDPEVTVE